ncbi:hypothetical protein ACF073_24265 [Streptomyces sp. NPDC015171]|uniref:hypothetical protein n=1 Tax=Streptomyces sp. NPDC015171 TaxID=3364945 RepID=UPI0037018543
MAPEQAAEFAARPGAADAVAVRRWDDEAKHPDAATPPFEHFLPLLTGLLRGWPGGTGHPCPVPPGARSPPVHGARVPLGEAVTSQRRRIPVSGRKNRVTAMTGGSLTAVLNPGQLCTGDPLPGRPEADVAPGATARQPPPLKLPPTHPRRRGLDSCGA